MKRLMACLVAAFAANGVLADTIITLKPEFSIGSDGKAIIVNAKQYCSDATYIFMDTTTAAGKSMYSFALTANAADKEIYIQTSCTCNLNCASTGAVPVYKMCTVLTSGVCQ